MKNLIENIKNQLSLLPTLRYIDHNWGQIDYYAPNHPVQWPICLVDVTDATYSNIGVDLAQNAANRQLGDLNITLIIADLKLTNSSLKAPQNQKDNASTIFELIELIHEQLHGFCPADNSSKMIRQRMQRTLRDDGIQEYRITYKCQLYNC